MRPTLNRRLRLLAAGLLSSASLLSGCSGGDPVA
jgi:hypothetical protein